MDTTLEQSYIKQTPLSYRRKKGQYFTPSHIAEVMVEWLVPTEPATILDPAVGMGIFPRALNQRIPGSISHWEMYDIDDSFIHPLQSVGLHMFHQDFLLSDWNKLFDGIIANPPYFKLRNHEHKEDLLKTFEEKLGIRLPGNTNIYNLFILKCLEQLNANGRAAFIVPSDFLNADYGQHIKAYLLEHKLLDYIVITDYQVSWFEEATTTSAILLCSREEAKDDYVEFINVQSDSEMKDFKEFLRSEECSRSYGKSFAYHELNPRIKWRHYYQDSLLKTYKNLRPFHEFGKAKRGIATGANDFFCLSESERIRWGLDKEVTVPCLIKAYQASEPFFTWENWESLKQNDHPVYVLQVKQGHEHHHVVKRYIQYGEEHHFHQRYLTKHRKPWYRPELRQPAPILFRVFNRSNLQFIRNEAGIMHLTSFHGLYIHECFMHDIDVVMAYFLTDVAKDLMKESRREYGKGLLKFEPNDLNQSWVVDFERIEEKEKEQIRELYTLIRQETSSYQGELLARLNKMFIDILKR